jgi:hypothetical protein
MASARELYKAAKVSAVSAERVAEDFHRAVQLTVEYNIEYANRAMTKAASTGAKACNFAIIDVMNSKVECGTAVMDEWDPQWRDRMSTAVVRGVVDNLLSRGFTLRPTKLYLEMRIECDTHKRNMRRWRGVVRCMVAMARWRHEYYRPGGKGAADAIGRASRASLQ